MPNYMKYRDLDIFLNKNVETNDIKFVSDNSSIIQSIKNIVLTKKGERPFNNYFGTGVVNLLFEDPSFAELSFLQHDIKTILTDLEPRIIVKTVEITYPTTSSDSDIKINISYVPNPQQQTNATQTLVLTVGT